MSGEPPNAAPKSNFLLIVRYDGREYLGWQRNGSQPTIQYALEQAITAAFGVRSPVQGSGRTDRGAHALAHAASVMLPDGLDPEQVRADLNDELPNDIEVLTVAVRPNDFHARMSAIGKQYRYVIWNAPVCPDTEQGRVWHVPGALDVEAMRGACPVFVGEHDFASFATRPNFKQKSTTRTLTTVELTTEGPRIEIVMCADGFLYKMVRNLVRALVKVGEGRTTVAQLAEILAARTRKAAPGTAPASGLYLDEVFYDA
jgi:tRNA pseudouridine38-40 synthase